MALLGGGVAAIWHDIDREAEADYHHWHCHEHIPERVGIPGFLRGRRYTGVSGEPRFFHFYETETLATLTSPAYLERLNAPTPWTQRVVPHFRGNNRTLARVAATFGVGAGAAILTLRIAAGAGRGEALERWIGEDALPGLVEQAGLVGAHLLVGDQAASRTETEEKAMRERPDEVADRVILVEGLEPEIVAEVHAGPLAPDALAAHGAASVAAGVYRLHYSLTSGELGGGPS